MQTNQRLWVSSMCLTQAEDGRLFLHVRLVGSQVRFGLDLLHSLLIPTANTKL